MTNEHDNRMEIKSDKRGETDDGKKTVLAGTTVRYIGHLPGGMVKVEFKDGTTGIMHPHCFPNFR